MCAKCSQICSQNVRKTIEKLQKHYMRNVLRLRTLCAKCSQNVRKMFAKCSQNVRNPTVISKLKLTKKQMQKNICKYFKHFEFDLMIRIYMDINL